MHTLPQTQSVLSRAVAVARPRLMLARIEGRSDVYFLDRNLFGHESTGGTQGNFGDEGGRWITLDGTHIHLKNGKIDKGPAALVGKSATLHPVGHAPEGGHAPAGGVDHPNGKKYGGGKFLPKHGGTPEEAAQKELDDAHAAHEAIKSKMGSASHSDVRKLAPKADKARSAIAAAQGKLAAVKAASAPASGITKDLYGKDKIDSSGIGGQSPMFHEPTQHGAATEAIGGSKAALDPKNTAALPFAEKTPHQLTPGKGGTEATHVLGSVKPGDRVEVGGNTHQVAKVTQSTKAEPIYSSTDPGDTREHGLNHKTTAIVHAHDVGEPSEHPKQFRFQSERTEMHAEPKSTVETPAAKPTPAEAGKASANAAAAPSDYDTRLRAQIRINRAAGMDSTQAVGHAARALGPRPGGATPVPGKHGLAPATERKPGTPAATAGEQMPAATAAKVEAAPVATIGKKPSEMDKAERYDAGVKHPSESLERQSSELASGIGSAIYESKHPSHSPEEQARFAASAAAKQSQRADVEKKLAEVRGKSIDDFYEPDGEGGWQEKKAAPTPAEAGRAAAQSVAGFDKGSHASQFSRDLAATNASVADAVAKGHQRVSDVGLKPGQVVTSHEPLTPGAKFTVGSVDKYGHAQVTPHDPMATMGYTMNVKGSTGRTVDPAAPLDDYEARRSANIKVQVAHRDAVNAKIKAASKPSNPAEAGDWQHVDPLKSGKGKAGIVYQPTVAPQTPAQAGRAAANKAVGASSHREQTAKIAALQKSNPGMSYREAFEKAKGSATPALPKRATSAPTPAPTHHVIEDPIGKGKGFKVSDLHKKLIDHHEALNGTKGLTAAEESELQGAAGAGNPFTFHRTLPTEIKSIIDKHPAAAFKLKTSDRAAESGGADAFSALGDRYEHLVAKAAGSDKLDAALKTARGSSDPAMQFTAMVHDNLPSLKGEGSTKLQNTRADKLKVGDAFQYGGHEFHVVGEADPDGETVHKVLRGAGHDFPLEALKGVPIPLTHGSLHKGAGPKLEADDFAPFSRADDDPDTLWLHNPSSQLHDALVLGQGLPAAVTAEMGLPTESLGQPIMYAWADALVVGDYEHPTTKQRFKLGREELDTAVATFSRLVENGVHIPFVKDHKETTDSSLGWVVGAQRVGNKFRLRHAIVGLDAQRAASRNLVSVKLHKTFTDSQRNKYAYAITHSSLTPTPVIPNQTGFIAASSQATNTDTDGDVPDVYVLAAPEKERSSEMALTPDQLTTFRKLHGAADVPEEKSIDWLLSYAATTTEEARTAKSNEAVLLSRIDEQEQQVLTLSTAWADKPKLPDDATRMLLSRAADSEWDKAVKSGGASPAVVKDFRKLFRDGDKPNVLALSRAGEGTDPLEFQIASLLQKNTERVPGEGERFLSLSTAMDDSKDGDGDKDAAAVKAKMIAMANGGSPSETQMAKMCKGD